jgi:hypothetical protein
MKRKLEILIGVLIFLVLVTLIFTGKIDLHSGDWQKIRCEAKEEAKKEEISGIVIKSFRDKENHIIKTVEFESFGKLKKSLILDLEVSGIHEELVEGDSIFKPQGQLKFFLIRDGNTRELMLDFECDQP